MRLLFRDRVLATCLAALSAPVAWTSAEAQIAGAAERAAVRAASQTAQRRASESAATAAAGRQIIQGASDRVLRRWSLPLCKPELRCPLPPAVARTFRGGSYDEVILQKDTTLYRVYSDPAAKLGRPGEHYSYWSRSDARGLPAAIDGAIEVSRWGNTAQNQVAIRVPRGTKVFEGQAGRPDSGRPIGGGSQVVLEKVRPEWVVPR